MFISKASSAVKRVCIGSKKQEEIVSSPKMSESKWPRHSWYKRLFNHRYKLALLPLLGMFVPNSNPKNVQETVVEENIDESNTKKPIDLSDSYFVSRVLPCSLGAGSIWLFITLVNFSKILNDRKRRAIHEVGHFIGYQAAIVPSKLKSLTIISDEESAGEFVVTVNSRDQDKLKFILHRLIRSQAGESLEKLRFGYYTSLLGCFDDRFRMYQQALFLARRLKSEPSKLFTFLKFWWKLKTITQDLLKQVDPKVVETLTNRLVEEEKWDTEDLESIVKEFGLDNFPPFEEVIPEVRRLLED